jgi:hypothetical protein
MGANVNIWLTLTRQRVNYFLPKCIDAGHSLTL